MTAWEYRTVDFEDLKANNLNVMGEKGWELVMGYGSVLIFKRPLPIA